VLYTFSAWPEYIHFPFGPRRPTRFIYLFRLVRKRYIYTYQGRYLFYIYVYKGIHTFSVWPSDASDTLSTLSVSRFICHTLYIPFPLGPYMYMHKGIYTFSVGPSDESDTLSTLALSEEASTARDFIEKGFQFKTFLAMSFTTQML